MWSKEFDRRAADLRERNERARLESQLGRDHLRIAEMTAQGGLTERHFPPKELAAL